MHVKSPGAFLGVLNARANTDTECIGVIDTGLREGEFRNTFAMS